MNTESNNFYLKFSFGLRTIWTMKYHFYYYIHLLYKNNVWTIYNLHHTALGHMSPIWQTSLLAYGSRGGSSTRQQHMISCDATWWYNPQPERRPQSRISYRGMGSFTLPGYDSLSTWYSVGLFLSPLVHHYLVIFPPSYHVLNWYSIIIFLCVVLCTYHLTGLSLLRYLLLLLQHSISCVCGSPLFHFSNSLFSKTFYACFIPIWLNPEHLLYVCIFYKSCEIFSYSL